MSLELPVFTKEMRARMRGTRTPILLFICTAIAILISTLMLFWLSDIRPDLQYSTGEQAAAIGKFVFGVLASLEGLMVALITPALTAGIISVEREQHTLEAVLLTPLSSRNIVMGKLFSVLGLVLFVLLCALPVMAIALVLGGVSPAQITWTLALLLATAVFFGAIGVYCSVRFQKTATAIVATYVICLAYLLLVPYLGSQFDNQNLSSDLVQPQCILSVLFCLCLPIATISAVNAYYPRLTHREVSRPFKIILWSFSVFVVGLMIYLSAYANDMLNLLKLFTLALIYAIPLVCLFSIGYTRLCHKRFSVRVNIGVWLITALSVTMAAILVLCTYSPPSRIHPYYTSFVHPEIFLYGNPIVALVEQWGFDLWQLEQAMINWMVPVTVILLLLCAWITMVMAERLLDLQLGNGMPERARGKRR